MAGSWSDLGIAAGSVDVGLRRIEVDPGKRSTPPHVHGAEEEIFYVLAGSGISWQDGRTCEVAAGDCLVHRAEAEAHTLLAGPDGLDVLAFGQRVRVEASFLPRANVAWLPPTWVDAGGGPGPWERDAAVGELEFPAAGPRLSTVVGRADVAEQRIDRGGSSYGVRDLARAAGSVQTGLRHLAVAAGKLGPPPHCHSAEEELFVVL